MARREDGELDTAIPEADRLEQRQPADPGGAPGLQWPTPAPDADEADRLEQAHEVLVDPDEEYAPSPLDQ
jgi:hypothetical protein